MQTLTPFHLASVLNCKSNYNGSKICWYNYWGSFTDGHGWVLHHFLLYLHRLLWWHITLVLHVILWEHWLEHWHSLTSLLLAIRSTLIHKSATSQNIDTIGNNNSRLERVRHSLAITNLLSYHLYLFYIKSYERWCYSDIGMSLDYSIVLHTNASCVV